VIIKVQVTQDDIDSSDPTASCGGNCPVWRAVRRVLPFLPHPWVTCWRIEFSDDAAEGSLLLPGPASAFITRFGGGQLVQPFEFGLDVPDDLIPAGAS